MSAELLQLLNGVQTMSIVGMCKNAGKTTMLNWMLHHDRLQGTLGLTSIGRDGESTDVVTGTEKPSIFVPAGTSHNPMRILQVDRPIFHFSVVTKRAYTTDIYK